MTSDGGPSVAKLVAAIVIGLVAIGVIVGGLFWLGNRGEPGGDGEVIAAPEGDYKVAPADRGGMNVAGRGRHRLCRQRGRAAQGQSQRRRGARDAGDQAPRPAPAAAAPRPPAPRRRPRPRRARPAPPRPRRPRRPDHPARRLLEPGRREPRLDRALPGRFRYLAPLGHSVVPAQVGGRTLYRLRASGADAADVCRRLRVAGEDCSVVS